MNRVLDNKEDGELGENSRKGGEGDLVGCQSEESAEGVEASNLQGYGLSQDESTGADGREDERGEAP